MALRFFDGFNYITSRWPGDTDFSGSYGRNGTEGMRVWFDRSATAQLDTPVAEGATIIFGVAMEMFESAAWDVGPDAGRGIIFQKADGTEMIRLANSTTTDNAVSIFIAGTEHDTGIIFFLTTWTYIEVKVFMDDSTGTVEVWQDGVSAYTATGQDTKAATGEITQVEVDSTKDALEWNMDDLYVLDDNDGGLTSRLGDVHVVTLQPTGDSGTHNDGVGSDADSVDNYLLVDDALGTSPDEADYVQLAAAADRQAFTTSNLGAGVVPKAVRVFSHTGGGDGLATTVDGFLRISSTDYDANDGVLIGSGYQNRDWYWDQNPATTADWAEDDLDGVEFGVRRTA